MKFNQNVLFFNLFYLLQVEHSLFLWYDKYPISERHLEKGVMILIDLCNSIFFL